MKKIPNNIKNLFWIFTSQPLSQVIKVLLFIVAARKLGVSEFGIFSYALSFYVVFSFLADLGVPAALRRKYAISKDKKKHFSYALTLKIWLTALSTILVLLVTLFVIKDTYTQQTVWVLWLFGATNLFTELFYSYFESENNLKVRGISRVARSIFIVVFGILVVYFNPNAISLAIAFLIESLLTLFCVILNFVIKKKNLILKNSIKVHKSILKESWRVATIAFLWNMFVSFDTVMLGLYNLILATGYYGAVQKIFSAAISPAIILPNMFVPILTKKFKDKKSVKKTIILLTVISLTLALGLTVAGLCFSKQIMQVIYGSEYIQASFALSVLLVSGGLICINGIFYTISFSLFQEKKIVVVVAIALVINILLNLYAIPNYGYNGAAVATLISTFMLMLGNLGICIFALKKRE